MLSPTVQQGDPGKLSSKQPYTSIIPDISSSLYISQPHALILHFHFIISPFTSLIYT